MPQFPRIPAILQTIFLGMLGLFVLSGMRISISLFVLSQHASPLLVGSLMATFALFPMLLSVATGRWLDRVGAAQPLRVGTLAMLVGAGLVIWPVHQLAFYFAAAMLGSGFMVVLAVTQSQIGKFGKPEERTARFTLMTLGMSGAVTCSPVLAGLVIDYSSHQSAFLLFGGCAVVLVALVNLRHLPQTKLPATVAKPRQQGSLRSLAWQNQHLRRVYVINFLLASAWDLFMFVTPIQGTQRGFSAATIGLIIGSFSCATFVIRFLMPLLSKRFSPWQIISATLGVASIGFFLFPWQQQAASMMVLAFVLGLGLGASQPNMLTLLFQAAPPERAGEALGIRMTIGNTIQVALPLAFGALGASMGLWPIFVVMSAALAVGLVWILRGMRKRQ